MIDLTGVLSMHRDELRARVAADAARLADVEARLRALEDGAVSTHDRTGPPFVMRALEPLRLAQLSAVTGLAHAAAPGPGLFARLEQRLGDAGARPAGPRIVHTHPRGLGRFEVQAGMGVADDAELPEDMEAARSPAVAEVVCLLATGPVEDVDADARALAWWQHDKSYRYPLDEPIREVHLHTAPGDPTRSVVELELPVAPVS